MKTKTIVIGSLFAAIAALFQLMPVFLSEAFLFLTIFSAIPIYIVSKMDPKAGIISYFVASIIVMTLSIHEGLFFLCTNGIVGLSLGIYSFYTERKMVIWLLSSFTLASSLSIMNYGIGIPIFGTIIPGPLASQIGIILFLSLIYIILYYYFSAFIYKLLKNRLKGH